MNYADTINLFLQSMDTHRHTRTNTQMNCEPFGGLIQNIIYSYIVGENSENLLVCAGGGGLSCNIFIVLGVFLWLVSSLCPFLDKVSIRSSISKI